MLASRTSRWSLGTALLCVLLLAMAWFLLISPRRADAADLTSQAAAENAQIGTLQQQLAQLKEQYAGLAKQKDQLKAIKAQLPPDADVSALVRNLLDFAGTAGISLDSVTPGAPVVLGSDGSVDANATATVGSVISVPLAINVTGQYFENSLYLKYLQTQMTRSILISGLSVVPATTSATTTTATATPAPSVTATAATTTANQDLTMTVNASVFVLLDGTSSLEDIKEEAKKAAVGTQTAATAAGTANTSTTR
jgi:Tfp pilus assembly protein PilO